MTPLQRSNSETVVLSGVVLRPEVYPYELKVKKRNLIITIEHNRFKANLNFREEREASFEPKQQAKGKRPQETADIPLTRVN